MQRNLIAEDFVDSNALTRISAAVQFQGICTIPVNFNQIALKAKALYQTALLDLIVGKEVYPTKHVRLTFEAGISVVFWLKKKIEGNIAVENSMYEDPDLGSDFQDYLNSQEEFMEKAIESEISKSRVFIKYMPTLGIHVMF